MRSACGGWAGIIFFSTMEAKALTLRRVATRSPFVPASRLSVSCRGTRARLQRGFPAPIRPWSTLESAPGAKPSRTIYHLDIFVAAKYRDGCNQLPIENLQSESARRSSTWKTFTFPERSRKCIVARARPHFLRRRVRVSKAFTAALDHRPVPSDNVSTSRPLHRCPVPGFQKADR